jgi:GntR family transcriptional regulator
MTGRLSAFEKTPSGRPQRRLRPAAMAADTNPAPATAIAGFEAEPLETEGDTPLYGQMYNVLRERIMTGRFSPGSLLPGEQELSRLFRVSRITVKRALNELAASGYVARRRGRGTLVTFNPAAPVVMGSFENLFQSLKEMGLGTQVDLLEVRETAADQDVARLLRLELGARVQRAVRLRKIEGEPFSYLITHVPAHLALGFDPQLLASRPLLQLLDEAGHRAVEAEQWITAVAAPAEVAKALGLQAGAPLLRIVRVMRAESGEGVEALEGFYRPDRFQHHMQLTRRRSRSGEDEWR